jgi:hypothetical protein
MEGHGLSGDRPCSDSLSRCILCIQGASAQERGWAVIIAILVPNALLAALAIWLVINAAKPGARTEEAVCSDAATAC